MMKNRVRLGVLPAVLAAVLSTTANAQTHWLVDASGGGDFTDVQPAIDAAAPGDVLLIAPGQYSAAVLTKRLRLLGQPAASGGALPKISSLDVQGASSFTLSHLDLYHLRVDGANNRSEVVDCEVVGGVQTLSPFSVFDVRGASDLLVARCSVVALPGGPDGLYGMLVDEGSSVQIVQSDVSGADAFYSSTAVLSGYGGHGVVVTGGSHVWISSSTLAGGHGQDIKFGAGCVFFGCDEDGQGGDALRVVDGSTADVRGLASDELRGGLQNPDSSGPKDGYALRCADFSGPNGSILYDGVTLVGAVQPCAVPFAQPMPRLGVAGTPGPGFPIAARLFGASGALGVLVGGQVPVNLDAPFLSSTPVFVDPAHLLVVAPVVLQGSDEAVTVPFVQPSDPALAGFRLHLQAVQIQPSGALVGTPANAIVLTW